MPADISLFQIDDMFAEAAADDVVEKSPPAAQKAVKIKKQQLIRVSREENLRAIWPKIDPEYTYHFITAGDIDAISFLTLLIETHGPFDDFYGSTWTMSQADVELIDAYLTAGHIKKISFFTGEFFKARETSIYASLLQTLHKHGGRLKMFRNHCKILMVQNSAANFWAVVEGSANFHTNPRTEQSILTPSRELYEFYKQWFEDLIKLGTNKTKP